VAHSTVRSAVGAGVVAASLLIVGPNPAQALADKHGSGPYVKNDDNRHGPNNRGGYSNRSEPNRGPDGFDGRQKASDPSVMDLGTSSLDLEDLAVADNVAPQGQIALRSASIAEVPASENITAAARAGDNVATAARAGDNVATAARRAGSEYAGQPASAFRAPRVVVGNGRTPGAHRREQDRASEEMHWQSAQVAAPAAVPPGPEAIEINVPPLPPPLPHPMPPVERMRPAAFVLGEIGTSTIDTVTDPLAGLAGLILIPAVGAVLGYRQAKAAQSLQESLRG
jgi:hypothetical protein